MKFEDALKKLEAVVARLESGECTLEESLDLYSQGVQMLKVCTEHLTDAEQKVEILLKDQRVSFALENTP